MSAKLAQQNKKLIIANLVGTCLEIYDMSIYAYFAAMIATNFFPHSNSTYALLNTFAIFLVSFIVRPIGAVLFGHLGDTLGRKLTLIITIAMITVGTCGIGLLPTTQQIGIAAPFCLIALRIIQGLSFAGEYVGSLIFLLEQAPPGKKAFTASFATCGGNIGLLLASIICWAVSQYCTPTQLSAWGWRVPFLLAAFGGLITIYLRKTITEHIATNTDSQPLRFPILAVLKEQRTAMVTLLSLSSLYMIICYLIYVWSTTCFTLLAHLSMQQALAINSLAIFLQIGLIPFIAKWADRIGQQPILRLGISALIVLIYPYYLLLSTGNAAYVLLAHLWITFAATFFTALLPVTIAELFPAQVRYSGMGLGYNIAGLAVGGTTPLVGMLLLGTEMPAVWLSLYFVFWATIALWGTSRLKKNPVSDFNSNTVLAPH